MSNIFTAAAAYQNQMKMMQNASAVSTQDDNAGGSFADMVRGALKDAVGAQQSAENLQMQSLTSKDVEISDLVTAISNAELTLNTVVAVRDKVINAYQDIVKMPI